MPRLRFTISFALALLAWPAPGAWARTIESQVLELIQGHDLGQSRVAILILDLDDGTELASINADDLMIPASNMKLITTAAAMDILKPDFKFHTQLRLIDRPDKHASPQTDDFGDRPPGVTLIIKGDGDPAFGDMEVLEKYDMDVEKLLDEWVQTVTERGLKTIDRLIVDDRVFDRVFVHPTWPRDQLQFRYCAQIAGVNIHRNVLNLYVKPGDMGQTPTIRMRPIAPFLHTNNYAVTDVRDNLQVDRKPLSNLVIFRGTIGRKRTRPLLARVTIHDPAMFFLHLLNDRLTSKGIKVKQVSRIDDGQMLARGIVLYDAQTTLYEVIQRCNSQSINLYAEALIKRMGYHYTGAPGSWSNGAAAIRQFLQQRLGTAAAVVSIVDGSGLSRENRVTPRILVKLLKSMYRDQTLGYDYIQSLSVSGKSGTLLKHNRLSGSLRGKVFAKTGYIRGVSALSGYVLMPTSKNSEASHVIAFSMLFNDISTKVRIADVRAVQDRIVKLIEQAYR